MVVSSEGPDKGESKTVPENRPHPPGLYALFSSEAFERFSYYGMRALLVLYLTKQLNYERKDALTVLGVYAGLVYLTLAALG